MTTTTTQTGKKASNRRGKRVSDAERASAAQARAAKLEALHDDLADQVEALATSDGWTAMLRAAAAFRAYSLSNVLLLAMQMDDRGMDLGQRVAGFTTWKTLGRSVRKGERGLAILAPCTYKPTGKSHAKDQGHQPGEATDTTTAASTEPETPAGAGKRVLRGFKVVHVFAYEQTDGEPLPDPIAPVLLEGDAPAGLWDGLAEQVAAAGYALERGECGQAEGYSDPARKVVRIREGLDDAHACSVLAHELAHVLLHCADGYDYAGHRGTAEIEAESVAYLVTTATGLPSGACAAPYVAGWARGDVAKVKAAATRVVTTAHAILDRLDGGTGEQDTDAGREAAA